MKINLTVILFFINLMSFSQSIETIIDKVSTKICDCMDDDMQSYSDIKPEFNKCFDKEFNQIFSIVDENEQKILVKKGVLNQIKKGIIPSLNKNCKKIKKLVDAELENTVEPSSSNILQAYPTNFGQEDFDDMERLGDRIIALKGQIVQIETSSKNTPYLKLKIGNNEIWTFLMIDCGFEKVGKKIKIIGYLLPLKKTDYESKFNPNKYQILAFGILDLQSEELAYFPGSEKQMMEWKSGKIPSSGK